jgi:hypothetical protein
MEVFEKLPFWRKVLIWAIVIVLPFLGSLADVAF